MKKSRPHVAIVIKASASIIADFATLGCSLISSAMITALKAAAARKFRRKFKICFSRLASNSAKSFATP